MKFFEEKFLWYFLVLNLFNFSEELTQLVEYLAYNEKVSGSSPLFFIFSVLT